MARGKKRDNKQARILGRIVPFAAAFLIAAWLCQPASAAPGIDQLFEKPASQKTWGERLADTVGFGEFSKSYALVVGISDYADGYADLPTGNDARRMADYLFNKAGFDYVHLLTEEKVTKARVAELMSDEFPDLLDGNDRFLFYWSGHGDTRAIAAGDGKAGYLPLSDTPSRKWSRMIAMEDVQRWQKFLSARQSLFLLDACFSGLAGFVPQSQTPRDWRIEQLSQSSHHVMSAGTESEKTIASDAWGGSLFTAAVLDGLRGDADARNGFAKDGIVSLTELKAYVQERVLYERQSAGWPDQITPQVRDLRLNSGEFFFLSGEPVEVARVDPTTSGSSGDITPQSGQTSPSQLTPEQIESSLTLDGRAIQRSLAAFGENPGIADGVLGPRSRAALRSWQSANGYEPTGYLTAEQYEKLLSDAEPLLAQAPVVRQTPEAQPSPIEPVVGLPSYEPLTTFRDCGDCPELLVIPAGAFFMGSREAEPHSEDNERPRHRVNIESFAIGKHEVTFYEWDVCVASGGCNHQPHDEGWGRGNRPVINVNWEDAQQYATWLSSETGQTYRLPSEAEWEYVARAFPTSKGPNAPTFAFGDGLTTEQANFGGNVGQTTEIGSYPSNAWGVHDMHGNVWEWVDDRWHDSYEGAPFDGRSWVEGSNSARVLRGGSWSGTPGSLRSAYRYRSVPNIRVNFLGFRVARTLTP